MDIVITDSKNETTISSFNNYKFCSSLKLLEKCLMDENKKMILDAMKEAGTPVRPGDLAKMTGIKSKEFLKS